MKRIGIAFFYVGCILTLLAQDKIFIHKTDNSIIDVFVSSIDSIVFSNNETELNVHKTDNTVSNYTISDIDSILFGSTSDTVYILFSENSATITNPLSANGVTVTVVGADVSVNSTIENTDVKYMIQGSSSNGSLKIYSNYRLDLILNGLNLANQDGPAINVQSSKKISVMLAAGTTNTLSDGITYATSTEDQKSTFFSEGQLVFGGTGSLNVSSISKHGICSDDYIQIDEGNIAVTSAGKDGIHCKDYFKMNGGSLNVTAASDGIDCEAGHINITGGTITTHNAVADVKSISCDSTMTISGGTISMTVSGNQSKGLIAKQRMNLTGGNITINTSGAAVLVAEGSGFEPSYCSAIKCDSTITLSGANLTITSTGFAGKGISGDANVIINSGTINISTTGSGTTYKDSLGLTESYAATCIKADGNLIITGGNITALSSGNGGKGLSADGTITIGDTNNSPTINIKTTGARFLVSGTDYCHPKTIVATGRITINNGTNIISSTDDGIHSETSVTINGGTNTIIASSTIQGIGEGLESKYIYITGGINTITASNDGINATMGTTAGGTEGNDGSLLSISGGTTFVTGSDAIDSNGSFTMTGGVVFANGPSSGAEEYSDVNGTCNLNGGIFVGCGSSQMQKSPSTTSTQSCLFMKSTFTSAAMLTVAIGGTGIVSFKPKNGGGVALVSSPKITKGSSYIIYTGGSYSGGTSTNNLYLDGTFSSIGATSKKSGTISNSGTVNSISF
ncbi:MAG: carbohydrate-binding domain-containing protein [Paludibacter sp.]